MVTSEMPGALASFLSSSSLSCSEPPQSDGLRTDGGKTGSFKFGERSAGEDASSSGGKCLEEPAHTGGAKLRSEK